MTVTGPSVEEDGKNDDLLPARLAYPERRTGRSLLMGAVAAVVVIAIGLAVQPALNSHYLFVVTTILAWSLIASSLNIVVGYAGQLNLANGAFLAVGAYVGVLGTGHWEWPGLLTIVVAGGIAYVVSTGLAFIIFRARGLHFALLTAGLSFVVYGVLIAWTDLTGGASGISSSGPLENGGVARPLELPGLSLSSPSDWYRTMLVFLVVLIFVLSIVTRRKTGVAWQAIRDNELLAASVGVDVARGKRTAFVASSVLVSVIGVFYGHWLAYVTPGTFDFDKASFEPLAMVIIGGSGTPLGPIIGAVIVNGMPEFFRSLNEWSDLIYGVTLLLVVMFAPKGVVGLVRRGSGLVKDKLRKVGVDE